MPESHEGSARGVKLGLLRNVGGGYKEVPFTVRPLARNDESRLRPDRADDGVGTAGDSQGAGMATVSTEVGGLVSSLGELGYNVVCGLGDLMLFSGRICTWLGKGPARGTLLASLNVVGVKSVPVV